MMEFQREQLKSSAKVIGMLLSVAAILSVGAPTVYASASQKDIQSVHLFSDGSVVADSSSQLVREESGVTMNLHTSGLPANNAVIVWWVIFNHPELCSHGVLGLRCGEGDLSSSDVQASVLYAAGNVVGGNSKGNFAAHLNVGDVSEHGCPSGAICHLFGPGLVNPMGADIHLIVHVHGPVDPALMPGEIHSFDICNPECVDLQFSPHEA
jgi:hypothetical protein